jgi:tetratricopeptide (TPR) repeat protein
MKSNGLIWAGCGVLLFFVAACATTTDEKSKKESKAYRSLGEAYMQQGKFALAMREFNKAEAKNPNDHILQQDLGLLYLRKKQYDQAIFYYKKVVGDILYGTPHYAYSGLGNAYYYKGNLEQSEKYYLEALEFKPDFVHALGGLAQTYIDMGRIPEAVEKLKRAVRSVPDSPALHFQMAQAYQLALEFKKSYNSYRKVVDLAPESPLAEEAEQEARKVRALY